MARQYELRVCYGKKPYGSYQEAEKCRQGLRRLGDVKTPMRSYRCEICKGWHFGHIPDNLQKGNRKRLKEATGDDARETPGAFDPEYELGFRPSGKRWRGAA